MAKRKIFRISQALTQGLEETVNAAHNYSGSLRVEVIPLTKIELDPENPRSLTLTLTDLINGYHQQGSLDHKRKQELESLKSLAESIKNEGILNPIIVYRYGDNYRLVAGERRTLASFLAGKTDVQAKILDSKPSEYKLALLQWIENIEREDLTLWEKICNLDKLAQGYISGSNLSEDAFTPTLLSSLIGCSLPHAMNYHAVLLADEEIKNLIKENKIKNLEKAALIAKIDATKLRKKAINACIQGAPLKELKAICNQKKTNASASITTTPHINKETRGRAATRINLGATKNTAAIKFIFNTVFDSEKYSKLKDNFQGVNWDDYKSVSGAFKELVKILEKNEE